MTNLSIKKEIIIVLTTEADSEKASRLANILLSNRVAACISFNQIKSRFWWEGKLEQSNEVQLIIKTNKVNLKIILNKIRQNHSYQNPELIFWIASTSNSYGKWINEVINSKDVDQLTL
tara:strand:+ start:1725 stop:2081 length:357 start_codon:yes stop_codon:yes gene_type:complete